MKRDMDTIRNLLRYMEEQDRGVFMYQMLPPMPDDATTVEHVQMMISGGLVESSQKGFFRVTWQGHEFLDQIRDDEIWGKTKAGANKVGSWSVKLLGDLASGFIRQKAIELGLPIV